MAALSGRVEPLPLTVDKKLVNVALDRGRIRNRRIMPEDDEPSGTKRCGGIFCQFQDALRPMDTDGNDTPVVRPVALAVTRDYAYLRVLNASHQNQMWTVAVRSGCPANMLYPIVQRSDRHELGDEAVGVHESKSPIKVSASG